MSTIKLLGHLLQQNDYEHLSILRLLKLRQTVSCTFNTTQQKH